MAAVAGREMTWDGRHGNGSGSIELVWLLIEAKAKKTKRTKAKRNETTQHEGDRNSSDCKSPHATSPPARSTRPPAKQKFILAHERKCKKSGCTCRNSAVILRGDWRRAARVAEEGALGVWLHGATVCDEEGGCK